MALGHARFVAAQTPFVPYFGKNNIHYDRFDWHIYQTDHFEIYYYPELQHHLERIAGYAESAYQQVSSDLHHDLSFKVPLILFKTHSEFEQQNVIPGAAQEGVGAFAEPFRDRMLLPIDDPPDRLYGLIAHELTHIFEFDIIPQSLIRRSVPLWVNEGLSDYERGAWTPLDLMQVRDAAVADTVPRMSELEGYGGGGPSRLIYNLGHAVFEFIEARWGKEGIRQFLFALRKSVIGGGEDAYEEAFRMKPEEFDQAFERYVKDRFKPFRDKERPADYGRDLAPNAERTNYSQAWSIAPSPSGDLMAVTTINRKDQELDIVPSRRRTARSCGTSPRASTRIWGSITSRSSVSGSTRCTGWRGRRKATASPISCARPRSAASSCRTCSPGRSRCASRCDRSTSRSRRPFRPTAAPWRSPACAAAPVTSSRSTSRRRKS
jgi:hypothetical protein